jgi:hypothetical protein
MYHSEATLLPDGRVLISGSNPQDPNFAEEHRLEVKLTILFIGDRSELHCVTGFPPPLPESRPNSNQPSEFQLTTGLTTVFMHITNVQALPRNRLPHSVYHSLPPHPVHTVTQWVQELSSPRSRLPGSMHVSSMRPQTAVFAHPVGTNSSSSTETPRLSSTMGPHWGDPSKVGNWPNLPGFTQPGV